MLIYYNTVFPKLGAKGSVNIIRTEDDILDRMYVNDKTYEFLWW